MTKFSKTPSAFTAGSQEDIPADKTRFYHSITQLQKKQTRILTNKTEKSFIYESPRNYHEQSRYSQKMLCRNFVKLLPVLAGGTCMLLILIALLKSRKTSKAETKHTNNTSKFNANYKLQHKNRVLMHTFTTLTLTRDKLTHQN